MYLCVYVQTSVGVIGSPGNTGDCEAPGRGAGMKTAFPRRTGCALNQWAIFLHPFVVFKQLHLMFLWVFIYQYSSQTLLLNWNNFSSDFWMSSFCNKEGSAFPCEIWGFYFSPESHIKINWNSNDRKLNCNANLKGNADDNHHWACPIIRIS